ncbi:NAD(P)H-dependent oxidoreductase [Heyndrickxia coagulans]|uniref:NAD(P)H-dependent oxidoreductase n=1 Tax=Heyndrickxia coagulans TaxID=1398 RepID=UPI002350AEFC|nr:NAD(P)H-dependent oxidoreductase [Heyndrickxia coagulans]
MVYWKEKKALHIQSSGSVYNGSDPASQYVKTLFTFLGFKDFQQLFIEGMDHFPERAEDIMEEAIKKAVEMGKTF